MSVSQTEHLTPIKFALVIGINYRGTSAELKGCINDAHAIVSYLVNQRGYSRENITLLTDDTATQPTSANIQIELARLVKRSYTLVSELWLHYSGHGSWLTDQNGDEGDRRDETIVPLDYRLRGQISDDKLHNFIRKINPDPKLGCSLFALFDCCHSGSVLDLRYMMDSKGKTKVESKTKPGIPTRANIVMLSGCTDRQTSAEDHSKYGSEEWSGAMTNAFLSCVMSSDSDISEPCTYEMLLQRIELQLIKGNFRQSPRISSNRPCKGSIALPLSASASASA